MTIGDNSIAGDKLKSFVERIEALNEEKKALVADIKEVFDEAKSEGYDAKVMRRVIKERAMDQEELDEFNALTVVYWGALDR